LCSLQTFDHQLPGAVICFGTAKIINGDSKINHQQMTAFVINMKKAQVFLIVEEYNGHMGFIDKEGRMDISYSVCCRMEAGKNLASPVRANYIE
jgi:hypothetical protein